MTAALLVTLFAGLLFSQQECAATAGARKIAVFAGGCFWCMEGPFESQTGVLSVEAGYTGGAAENPNYEAVTSGKTGHYEAIRITYDPVQVSYPQLLAIFWRQIDPTDEGGQFADRGSQYGTAIFYGDEEQRREAEASKERLAASGWFDRPIVTAILPAAAFYPAESYHQQYHRKNPLHYSLYKKGSGREAFQREFWQGKPSLAAPPARQWQKPSTEVLRARLSPLQYKVTQEEGTEPPFANPYWNSKEAGIYVDVVSGQPLFSSLDKFDSGTGWPSFTRTISDESVVTKADNHFFSRRTEVRSSQADSHLGHVFDDGPPPTGLRYCINSAALRFVPRERLTAEGYGDYEALFTGE